jgi:hypothetical protein
VNLPGIDYNTPVPDTSRTTALPYEAVRGLTDVIREGLSAYHQELVKSQLSGAELATKARLNKVREDIAGQQYADPEQLKELFGDQMPQHVAIAVQQYDGQPIPMPAVSDAIFNAKAKEIVAEEQAKITATGWQAHFEEKIGSTVEDQRHQLASQQITALDTYLNSIQKQQLQQALDAGLYQDARKKVLHDWNALRPNEKTAALTTIQKAEEMQPIREAVASNSIPAIDRQLARLRAGLKDGRPPPAKDGQPEELGTAALSPEERQESVQRLELAKRGIIAAEEQARERWYKSNASNAYNRLAEVEKAVMGRQQAAEPSYVLSLIPDADQLKGEDHKALLDYAASILKGERRTTDLGVYQAISLFAAQNPDDFAADRILIEVPGDPTLRNPQTTTKVVSLLSLAGNLSEVDARRMIDLQASLNREGRESALFQDFLGGERYLEAKLAGEYGFNFDRNRPMSDADAKKIGQVKIAVQGALEAEKRSNKGKLTTMQRDKVIDDTLKRVLDYKKGLLVDTKENRFEGENMDAITAFDRLFLGRATPAELKTYAREAAYYEPGFTTAWRDLSKRTLGYDTIARLTMYQKAHWGELNAAVKAGGFDVTVTEPKQKLAVDNARAALAVKRYLETGGE